MAAGSERSRQEVSSHHRFRGLPHHRVDVVTLEQNSLGSHTSGKRLGSVQDDFIRPSGFGDHEDIAGVRENQRKGQMRVTDETRPEHRLGTVSEDRDRNPPLLASVVVFFNEQPRGALVVEKKWIGK